MNKQQVIQLLKRKKRGAYIVLVNLFNDEVNSMPATIALEVIEQNLSSEAGEEIKLNYFSLKKAISRLKKKEIIKIRPTEIKKWDFKDAHELNEDQFVPGKFKLVKKNI